MHGHNRQHFRAHTRTFLLLLLSVPSGFPVVFEKPSRSSFTCAFTPPPLAHDASASSSGQRLVAASLLCVPFFPMVPNCCRVCMCVSVTSAPAPAAPSEEAVQLMTAAIDSAIGVRPRATHTHTHTHTHQTHTLAPHGYSTSLNLSRWRPKPVYIAPCWRMLAQLC